MRRIWQCFLVLPDFTDWVSVDHRRLSFEVSVRSFALLPSVNPNTRFRLIGRPTNSADAFPPAIFASGPAALKPGSRDVFARSVLVGIGFAQVWAGFSAAVPRGILFSVRFGLWFIVGNKAACAVLFFFCVKILRLHLRSLPSMLAQITDELWRNKLSKCRWKA